jgi:acetyl esterase/lipase
MSKKLIAATILFFIVILTLTAQEKHALYTGNIPNSKPNSIQETFASGMYRGVTIPELEAYLPDKEKATGAAVVICPGGGYSVVVYQGEGVTTAKAFAERGIAAFVLKYRLPDENTMPDKKTGPLQDAQQAIKLVRENSSQWGINPNKIGIMGFSAGGHLASTAATHFSPALVENSNNTSLRPDFQILVYPVISMQNILTHAGSRQQLLGSNPDQVVIDLFSNELQVDENTPPAYITHAADDKLVDVDNSISYFEQLRKHGVSVEMHIYPKGGHGFVFGMKDWMDPLFRWMKSSEIISN